MKRQSTVKWAASIDDTKIAIPDPTVSEAVLRAQAGVPGVFVIVRDHNSPDDVVLKSGETVDLRDGNVFYTIRAAEVGKRKECANPAKRAVFVDDRIEEIGKPDQTGGSIRALFELPEDVALFRDLHSPNDVPIEVNTAIDFRDGPVFYTRAVNRLVEVSINGRKYKTQVGKNSVQHLKALDGVSATDILSELRGAKFVDLKDTEPVHIKGGEVFVSHPPSAGSSK
ncbi:MAG: hypothetical protein WAO00_05695 [Chthoniobacterales bacterium]